MKRLLRAVALFGLGLALLGACKKDPPAEKAASGPPVCVAGAAVHCTQPGMKWTGSVCCVDAPATCVAGTATHCAQRGMKWTGNLCCLEGAATCAPGTAISCTGPGQTWSGELCCTK